MKWHKLEDLATKGFHEVPNVSGIYVVRWSRDGKPVCIPRLGGSDLKGILYIGRAKRLRRRVRQLWAGVNQKAKKHTIARTIIFCKVFQLVNLNEYEISWEEFQTGKDAEDQEWAAFKLYGEKYREPPPLNLVIHRKLYAVFGIATFGEFRFAPEPHDFVKSVIN